MKKQIFIAAMMFSLLGSMASAQKYKSIPFTSAGGNANGVVYCLPQTDVVVKFTVEKTTRTKGIYSESAYLLGIDNAALKNTTSYRITGAEITGKISPDYNKQYILIADDNINVQKTSFGTIKSITGQGANAKKYSSTQTTEQHIPQTLPQNKSVLPNTASQLPVAIPTYEYRLMQQGLMTKYPQMTAEKTVAEIKKLRDKQIELLSGSWEGTYMNTTVDYMYKQLDEIINSYVSLFTGVETTVTEEYYFVITPEKPIILEEDLLLPVCKFSQTNGLMDLNESGEGTKIVARIHSYVSTEQNAKNDQMNRLSDKQKSQLEKNGAGVYYCIPQTVKVTLQGVPMDNTSAIIKLMQYGSVSFTNDHEGNIIFDENTGEIIRMW